MSKAHILTRGTFNIFEAACKPNPTSDTMVYANNITMRSANMVEMIRAKEPSLSVEDAHIKSLRLYRRFCRLIPFLIRNNYLQFKTTPALAKQQLATHFRKLAKCTNVNELDLEISEGYEQMLTLQQNYVQPSGAYHELAPKEKHRDCGVSFFQKRYEKKNKPATSFLTGFYNLRKDPES